jgi:3-deoxy-D-manno-octulosonate 8-phosphate phosphatase (KDO 8-P phosphatase)
VAGIARRAVRTARRALAPDVAARARRVRAVLFDVDGVLTADRVLVDPHGRLLRELSLRDATALALLARAGVRVALLAERRAAVAPLARRLGVETIVERGATVASAGRRLCRRWRIAPAELGFVGDDLLDQPLLALAGLAVTVADGARGLAGHVHLVTAARGGAGAVREVAELILRAQGKWASVVGESMR